MKTCYCYVVNPRSKECLGKFRSFSQAKTFQAIKGLLTSTQIWGFHPKQIKLRSDSFDE